MIPVQKRTLYLALFCMAAGFLFLDVWAHAAGRRLFLVNHPLHTAMEVTGAIAALMMSAMLLHREEDKWGSAEFLAAGFLGLGILSFLHAITPPGRGYVLLYGAANVIGGLCFALSWLSLVPGTRAHRRGILWGVGGGSALLGGAIILFRASVPTMLAIPGGHVAATAAAVNIVAGLLYLAAAAYFLLDFQRTGNAESYLLAGLFLLLGFADLAFFSSAMWSVSWWLWHLQRLFVFCIVLLYLFVLFIRTDNELRMLNKSLERQVAERTAVLAGEIEERKRMEKKIVESEARYHTLFNQSPDAVLLLDAAGTIVDFNEKTHVQLGYTREEFSRLRRQDIDPVEGTDDIGARIDQLMREGKAEFEVKHRTKTGEIKDHHVITQAIRLSAGIYFHTIWRDITESRRMERRLRESENKFRSFFESANDGLYIVDPRKGRILDANTAAYTRLGYTKEELLDMPLAKLVEPDYATLLPERMERIVHDGSLALEAAQIKKDGSILPVEINARAIELNGQQVICSVVRDITERKQAEITLREAMRSAQEEKVKTEAFLSAIGDSLTVHDAEYRIIFQNQISSARYGHRLGEYCYRVYHDRDSVCDDCAFPQALADGKMHKCELTRTEGGAPTYYELTSSPVRDATGTIIGGIELSRDVTVRKQAEEVLRRSNEELELLVKKRTAELTMLNEQLRGLSVHLQQVRENDRAVIAREIHDDLGQSLTALKMDLSFIQRRLPAESRALTEKADSMARIIVATIDSVKRISTELRPGILDHLGLTAAMEWQAQEFEKRSDIPCDIVFAPAEIALDRYHTTEVFRIFQETLTNVARHADATEVSVLLQIEADSLVLRVQDNGRGITDAEKADPKSLGLIGMRERVNNCGGSLAITGVPDTGTVVNVRFPLERIGIRR